MSLQDLMQSSIYSRQDEIHVWEPTKIVIDRHVVGWCGLRDKTIVSHIEDGSPVITIEAKTVSPPDYIDCRYLDLSGLKIIGNGKEGDGLVFRSLGNVGMYGAKLDRIAIQGVGGHGFVFEGYVFEFDLHSLWTQGCKKWGALLKNGPGNFVCSAMMFFGGGHRDNVQGGVRFEGWNTIYGFNDARFFATKFINNGGMGLFAPNGCTLVNGCHFENNKDLAAQIDNFGAVIDCTASTYGKQPDFIKTYLGSGNSLAVHGCSNVYYGTGVPNISLVKATIPSGDKTLLKLLRTKGKIIINNVAQDVNV